MSILLSQFVLRPLRFAARWGFRLAILTVLFVAFVIPTGDVRRFSALEIAASEHLFSIPAWEINNFLDKWTNRVISIFGGRLSDEEGQALLTDYSDLSHRIRVETGNRDRVAADLDATEGELEAAEHALSDVRDIRRSGRDDTEEYLESAISATLRELGFGGPRGFLWPPVDFRLEEPPHVLVTSPRDRIERLDTKLLEPGINALQSEVIEARLLEDANLSAIVLSLGGVATFPTFVSDDKTLLDTLDLASHEWLHAYFFFRPLGQNINSGSEMNILNETVANIAGEELGILTYERLTGEKAPQEDEDSGGDEEFSFDDFMRETRRMTDALLFEGDIEGAEAYMEARRVELQDHRFFIRKLNQAWFGFNGTYGDSPASVSPIGDEVKELRSLLGDVGELIRQARGVGSYEEFQEVLQEARDAAAATSG